MNPVRKILYTVLALAFFAPAFLMGLFTAGCANMAMPEGGPKDTLPPKILSCSPANGSVNFNAKKVFIEMDEYVTLKDLNNQFFTSPFMDKKPKVISKKKGVQIELTSALDSNTTYVFSFGQSIADNNEGNVLEGYTYVVSTGTLIDSMRMSALALNAETRDTMGLVYLLFFPEERIFTGQYTDSVTGAEVKYDSTVYKKAGAVAKTNPAGFATTYNLKGIRYRIYAMLDNGNNKYDKGADMVGFLDSLVMPGTLGDFSLAYDSIRKSNITDPQITVRLFREKFPARDPSLSTSRRDNRNKVVLMFNAPNPRIDSLVLEGIDPSLVLRQNVTKGNDTIAYWINIPKEQLSDSMKGHVVYEKIDSLGQKYMHSQELKLNIAVPQRAVRAARKEEEADTVHKVPIMKYTVDAQRPLVPVNNIRFRFDSPVGSVDMERIVVEKAEKDTLYKKIDFRFEQDTTDVLQWVLSADWAEGEKYRMLIPEGTIVNYAGEVNDTIKSSFDIASRNKFGTVKVALSNAHPDYEYIVQLVTKSGKTEKIIGQRHHLRNGEESFLFINPGNVMVRVTEDRNRNGEWDPGDVVQLQQPEKVEIYMDKGQWQISIKENWEQLCAIDLAEMFAVADIKVSEKFAEPEVKEEVKSETPSDKTGKKDRKKKRP